jgi:hypothetical protein
MLSIWLEMTVLIFSKVPCRLGVMNVTFIRCISMIVYYLIIKIKQRYDEIKVIFLFIRLQPGDTSRL